MVIEGPIDAETNREKTLCEIDMTITIGPFRNNQTHAMKKVLTK